MKINQKIKSLIVGAAVAALHSLADEEKTTASKSDKQRDLDAIFARHPNDAMWRDLSEVLRLSFGYAPAVVPAARKNFQVMVRENKKNGGTEDQTWIILKDNQFGFGTVGNRYFQLHQSDRPATWKESEAFIAQLEQIEAPQFMAWLLNNLGADYVSTL